jgi:hypothetical protein
LWVQDARQLTLREAATDKVIMTVKGDVWARPALTPGSRWLVAYAGHDLLFLDARDGTRAGSIPMPGSWGGLNLAVHPSGRSVALAQVDINHRDLLIAVWELATGKLTDSQIHKGRKVTGEMQWVGERRLLCGPALVDLDRHMIVCDMEAPAGAGAPSGLATPDGRIWFARTFTNEEWVQAEKKLPPAKDAAARTFLTAASLPELLTRTLEGGGNTFVWHPGVAVRVVAGDSVPRRHRAAIAEACANYLATEGFRVDPNAPITVEVAVKMDGKKGGTGRPIPREELSDAQKRELMFNPGKTWVEATDVYDAGVQTRVHAGNRLAFESQSFLEQPTVKQGAGEDAAWEALAKRGFPVHLPRVYLRDEDHRRLTLPGSFRPGVDGLLDPVFELRKGPGNDGFDLAGEG